MALPLDETHFLTSTSGNAESWQLRWLKVKFGQVRDFQNFQKYPSNIGNFFCGSLPTLLAWYIRTTINVSQRAKVDTFD